MNQNSFYLTHDVHYLHKLIFFYTSISYTPTYTLQLLQIYFHTPTPTNLLPHSNFTHTLTYSKPLTQANLISYSYQSFFHTTYELEVVKTHYNYSLAMRLLTYHHQIFLTFFSYIFTSLKSYYLNTFVIS